MQAWRDLLSAKRRLVAIVLTMTLCLKMLIPAGYMPDIGDHTLAITICADSAGGHMAGMAPAAPDVSPAASPTTSHKGTPASGRHDSTTCVCPFSVLAHQCLSGAEPALLVVALVAIFALNTARETPAPRRVHQHLRPPLRGPPLPA